MKPETVKAVITALEAGKIVLIAEHRGTTVEDRKWTDRDKGRTVEYCAVEHAMEVLGEDGTVRQIRVRERTENGVTASTFKAKPSIFKRGKSFLLALAGVHEEKGSLSAVLSSDFQPIAIE